MKLLLDFFPILLFFIAYKLYDIYVATAVAIVASILQVAYVYFVNKRVEKMHIITLALIVVLGGATLILQDETFIKWKPTIVNWGFALVFLGSHYIGKKPIINRMMDQMISMPDKAWLTLSHMWIGFFVLSGAVNIFVAYAYDTDTWVNFKLFGLMGMTIVFILLQGLYISRNMIEEDKDGGNENEEDHKDKQSKVVDASLETLADAELDSVVAHKEIQKDTPPKPKE